MQHGETVKVYLRVRFVITSINGLQELFRHFEDFLFPRCGDRGVSIRQRGMKMNRKKNTYNYVGIKINSKVPRRERKLRIRHTALKRRSTTRLGTKLDRSLSSSLLNNQTRSRRSEIEGEDHLLKFSNRKKQQHSIERGI